ncbi:hypothetical protein P152DRAFT_461515 [Eremomyces bilateralis CBS 781.70]|uniref:UBR-type domain-containing protein n=1 Tax=Eremomyces bilateralis CBS 781.70 TaxID=1392243 RepID=A0A6G1FUG5_9PEZI|nr:uncharacterized protein P152DRAFT_461515 [Eremomyces bilateralis CBS 781.70]KAF1809332.1 hypothetical protein P152DRAFT_461515 [Eremomyces bilateralis CBS 781.70]
MATSGSVAAHQLRERQNSFSQVSESSQTAQEFINSQLQLEEEAREALPYQFDTCTKPLGPLRQLVFSCLTCNPPPSSSSDPYNAAGVCYSCSISCHGDHTLVELFNKRDFVCDCGTSRLPESTPCTLRINPVTGTKGDVRSEPPREGNSYNRNFRNQFCGCGEEYDPHQEKGTMFQCLGLGSEASGGCGEDWWHPECLVGLPRNWAETHKEQQDKLLAPTTEGNAPAPEGRVDGATVNEEEPPLPPGFPAEEDFESFICYKCVESNPWVKQYAGSPGFLPAVYFRGSAVKFKEGDQESSANGQPSSQGSAQKRKAHDYDGDETGTASKRFRSVDKDENDKSETNGSDAVAEADIQQDNKTDSHPCRINSLPPAPSGKVSLFLQADFRERWCKCPRCFPLLAKHPWLLEEEDTYEPPISEDGEHEDGGQSAGTRSMLDMGEAALSNVDRVRAIEGVMVYNKLKEQVKSFLQPFAESGQAVSAEDVKQYFERLRGDQDGIQAAAAQSAEANANGDNHRRDEGKGRNSYVLWCPASC